MGHPRTQQKTVAYIQQLLLYSSDNIRLLVLEQPGTRLCSEVLKIPGAETAGKTSKSKDCGNMEETGDFVHRTVWYTYDVGRGRCKREGKILTVEHS